MQMLLRVVLGAYVVLAGSLANAQGFPAKPIRLVVPYAPGGASDILARILGQKLSEVLEQQILIDNRPGAGGIIGSDLVAKAPPDGYTLILANVGTHAINAGLYSKMPYDPVKDFAPITMVATGPTVLVVHPALPIKSMADLLKYARENPGRINFASAGTGSTQHLAGELLKSKTGIGIVHVPYKGGGPALTDLLAGQVQMMFPNIPPVRAFVASGKLRAIAMASSHRSPLMPEVPTVMEATGVDSFDVSTWFGVLAPAGTPREVVAKLHDANTKVLRQPDMRARLAVEGLEPLISTPEEFGRYIREEVRKWSAVVKETGTRVD